MDILLPLVLGVCIGSICVFFWKKSGSSDSEVIKLKIEKEHIEKEKTRLLSENQNYKQEEIKLRERSSSLQTKNEELEKELDKQKQLYEERTQEKEKHFEKELNSQKQHYEEKFQEREQNFTEKLNAQEKLYKQLEEKSKQLTEKTKSEFENIVLNNTKSFREESTKNLSQILNPFKENIDGFKKSIQGFENKEKFLDETIKSFNEINSKMRDEAKKLTQALQGNTKSQGEWGEFVLENILEKSGLRKGEEYRLHGQGLGIKDDNIRSPRPDAIIMLPDNKHIVIDSKVSFTHYNRYISSNTEEERQQLLEKVLDSISSHIDNLSSKNYHFAEGLNAPDFTLMFVPNEGVFALATQTKRNLFDKAWKQSIVLVSPTTLYATLRTIASLWKIERQNKNAEEIAKQGGLLYDKFVGFIEDMNKIGSSLKTAGNSYDEAVGKLKEGRGNLIQKVKKLKNLGARNRKEIPADFESE